MSSIAVEAGPVPAGANANPFAFSPSSGVFDEPDHPERLRRKRLDPLPLALTGAIAVVAAMFWMRPAAPPPEVVRPPAAAQWVDVNKPLALFDLSGTEFGKDPKLEARRHKTGGGRIDTLVFGQMSESQKPWLRLSLYRIGAEEPESPSFFVEMARRAADAQIAVARSAAPNVLTTRFGDFETADLTLSSASGEKSCLGFRFGTERDDFRMSGLACGTAARPMDRAILFCTIDRLDLLGAGEDPTLRAFFAEAETRRGKGCMQSRLTAAASRENWLDASAPQPPLRAGLQQVARKPRR